jgi:hypothetical protein
MKDLVTLTHYQINWLKLTHWILVKRVLKQPVY